MRALPDDARELLNELDAHPRLMAHQAMVHDVACSLMEGILAEWPDFPIDVEAVEFGAATHDVGKTLHLEGAQRAGSTP